MLIKTFLIGIVVIFASGQQCLQESCLQCQTSPIQCTLCDEGYSRTISSRCISSEVAHCALYDDQSRCIKCQMTFKLSNNNQCEKSYEGCLDSTGGACRQCGFGKVLNSNICSGVLNCKVYRESSQTQCSECLSGFVLEGNRCRDTSGNCDQVDPASGACRSCISGYELVGYQCVLEYIDPQYCQIYTNDGTCLHCDDGFVELGGFCYTPQQITRLSNDQSVPGRRIFQSFSSAQTVVQESPNQLSSADQPSSSNASESNSNSVARCITYSSANPSQCTQCQSEYVLLDNRCFFGIEGCERHVRNGNTVICARCEVRFELEPSTRICLEKSVQSAVTNCLVPSADNLTCLVCDFEFVSNANGKCVSNTVSSTEGAGENSNPFCEVFNSVNLCLECKSGYSLNDNSICTDPNCQSISEDFTQCEMCKTGFKTNSDGLCIYDGENCERSTEEKCLKCNDGYFMRTTERCSKIPFGCEIANPITGFCSICQSGYTLSSSTICKRQQSVQNCLELETNPNSVNLCKTCIEGYYPFQTNCKKVSSRCGGEYDRDTGNCLSCILGFELNENGQCMDINCVRESTTALDTCEQCREYFSFRNDRCRYSDINCQVIQSNRCLQCFEEFELNDEGRCVEIQENGPSDNTTSQMSTHCLEVSAINQSQCIQCHNQYYPNSDGQCVFNESILETPLEETDSNCRVFDPANSEVCIQCRDRFYVGQNSTCVQVDELCEAYSQITGLCLSCYEGFILTEEGICVIETESSTDPNCIELSQADQSKCNRCVSGYFVHTSTKKCTQANPLCKTINPQNGFCLTCYQGYELQALSETCIIKQDDPNCVQFAPSSSPNSMASTCIQCKQRYFLNQITEKCQKVQTECQSYDSNTGECFKCADGFIISDKRCVAEVSIEDYVQDYYCKAKDELGTTCIECYQGYYLDKSSVCRRNNPLCQTIEPNSNGQCSSCYQGYVLTQGACIIPSNLQVTQNTFNLQCKTFSEQNSTFCLECYDGFRLTDGVCLETNPLCKTLNSSNGKCLSCYQGYLLRNGLCLVDDADRPNEIDPFCILLKEDSLDCQRCAPGYFVGSQGWCEAFDSVKQCETFNELTGRCDSCLYGFVLASSPGICVEETKNCQFYDDEGQCVQCQTGYFLKDTVCFVSDIKCQVYDAKSGSCNKCISGHVLSNNQCIFPTFGVDLNCKTYVNSFCTECHARSYLLNFRCRQIDSNCAQFDYIQRKCLKCQGSMKVRGVGCVTA